MSRFYVKASVSHLWFVESWHRFGWTLIIMVPTTVRARVSLWLLPKGYGDQRFQKIQFFWQGLYIRTSLLPCLTVAKLSLEITILVSPLSSEVSTSQVIKVPQSSNFPRPSAPSSQVLVLQVSTSKCCATSSQVQVLPSFHVQVLCSKVPSPSPPSFHVQVQWQNALEENDEWTCLNRSFGDILQGWRPVNEQCLAVCVLPRSAEIWYFLLI